MADDYRTIRLTDEQSSWVAAGHDSVDQAVLAQIGANLRGNAVFFRGALDQSQQSLDLLDAEIRELEDRPVNHPREAVDKAARLDEMGARRQVLASQVSTWSFHALRSERAWELWQLNIGGG